MYLQSTIPVSFPCPYPVTDIDLAYAAGIFDGEGSVSIVIVRKSKSSDVIYHQLTLSVANTHFGIIDWLHERFGGTIRNQAPQDDRRKASRKWQLGSRSAAQFLAAIRPYLIIKAQQADIAAEMQASRISPAQKITGFPRGRNSLPVSAELFAAREDMRARLNALNKKGPR